MKCVHRNMCDIGVDKQLVSVMTITSRDDHLTTGTHGNNQTLHNTWSNVLPLMLQYHKKLLKCLGWCIPLAYPVYSIDVLVCFNAANGKAKVMSRYCVTAETPNICNLWTGTFMQKHSTVANHVQNEEMLQDLISISDAH